MRLVRKDNPDVEIIGTLERISGTALIQDARRSDTGELVVQYAGETQVWWDSQQTVRSADDSRIFIDENGEEVDEFDVEVVP